MHRYAERDETRGAMTQLTNPVLGADPPDPETIRAGDDYYPVASSFHRAGPDAPGSAVLGAVELVVPQGSGEGIS